MALACLFPMLGRDEFGLEQIAMRAAFVKLGIVVSYVNIYFINLYTNIL